MDINENVINTNSGVIEFEDSLDVIQEANEEVCFLPDLSFDKSEIEEVQTVLKSWGLQASTCILLKVYGYNSITHLESLSDDDIKEIFSKLDNSYYGERSLLTRRLQEWKEQRGVQVSWSSGSTDKIIKWLEKINDAVCSSRSQSPITNTTTSTIVKDPTANDVKIILNDSIKGQEVLTYYKHNLQLDKQKQKVLVSTLVDFYTNQNRKMSCSEMEKWANAIEKCFPNEKSAIYFLPRQPGKKNPTGKLHSKWANVSLDQAHKTQIVPTQPSISTIDEDIGELEDLKLWLYSNISPWAQIQENWKKTCQLRMKDLQNTTNGVSYTDLLLAWPRYNDDNGYQLIDIDFDYLFAGKGNNLLANFDSFCLKIIPIFSCEIKDKASLNLMKTLLNGDIDQNSKHCVISMLLHALLQPRRINKNYKPTILEGQTDFILHVTSFNNLQLKIQQMTATNKQQGNTIQPKIIVVGPELQKLEHFYVYADGLKFKMGSFKKCLDCIIKMVYVFQLRYSNISKLVWGFLENYFFEFESEKFSEVINLINKLK